MQFLCALILLSVFFIYLWPTGEAYYVENYAIASSTTRRMKHKIVLMDRELTLDALMKRASVNQFKTYYDFSTPYQIAEYAYKVKQKYKRMLFIYMKCHENKDTFPYEEIMQFVKEAQHLKALIDNVILMLEEWEDRNTRKKRINRSGGGGGAGAGESNNALKDNRLRQRPRTTANTKQNVSIRAKRRRIPKVDEKRQNFLKELALGIPNDYLEKEIFRMKNKWEDDGYLNNLMLKTYKEKM